MAIGIHVDGLIPAAALFTVTIVMPVKWAASFADAERTDFVSTFVAVVVGVVLAVLGYKLLGGGFLGVIVGFILMSICQAKILLIPGHKFPGYLTIAILLQLAVGFAIATLPI